MGCKLRPLLVANNTKTYNNQFVSKCETLCSSEFYTIFISNKYLFTQRLDELLIMEIITDNTDTDISVN